MLVEIRGRLVAAVRNPGSKSEQWGWFIRTPEGDVAIERKGAPPFGDRSLDPLADRQVLARGELYRGRFLAESIEPAEDPAGG